MELRYPFFFFFMECNQLFAFVFHLFQRLYQNRTAVMDDISNHFNRVPYSCQIWLGDSNKAHSQVSLLNVIHHNHLYIGELHILPPWL
jgi:hypothetical protein